MLTFLRSSQLYAWKGPSLLIVDTAGECGADERLSGYYFREARFLSRLGLTINGGLGADLLEITSLPDILELPVLFNGNGGVDHIRGPPSDTLWSLTGAGSGTVGGLVDFTGVESVEGAAGNEDTFVFEPGGSLPGLVDGGAGGFDSLVVNGDYTQVSDTLVVNGDSTDITSVAFDASSGSVTVDGRQITYAGLEPVLINSGSAATAVFTLTSGNDEADRKKVDRLSMPPTVMGSGLPNCSNWFPSCIFCISVVVISSMLMR